MAACLPAPVTRMSTSRASLSAPALRLTRSGGGFGALYGVHQPVRRMLLSRKQAGGVTVLTDAQQHEIKR